jgi:hypothetical protein
MNYFIFWLVFALLLFIIIYSDKKYNLLRDTSTNAIKPYSFSRVQLVWWTLIVIASFISVFVLKHALPTFDASTLYLLGISTATTATATVIDLSDQKSAALVNNGLSQNEAGENFFLDILSDKNGVSIHRLQTVIFNLIFGVWFIIDVLHNLNIQNITGSWVNCNELATDSFCSYINSILPAISSNNLILLGLSSGTYAALKATENKQTAPLVNTANSTDGEAVG